MELKVLQAGNVKEGQYGPYGSVKSANGDWYVVNGDPKQHVGKTLSGTVQDKGKYKVFKVDFIVEDQPKQQTNGAVHPDPLAAKPTNGMIAWSEYEQMARHGHGLAMSLEPDTQSATNEAIVDRSQARIALVQTVLVAFRDGKLSMPESSEEPF